MPILNREPVRGDGEAGAVWEVSQGEPHWELLHELYQLVIATKWKPIMEDIYQFIGKNAPSNV